MNPILFARTILFAIAVFVSCPYICGSGKQARSPLDVIEFLNLWQDADAGQLSRNLIDQSLEEIWNGCVYDQQDGCTDHDDDQDFHRAVQKTFTGLIFQKTVEDHFYSYHVGVSLSFIVCII